MGVERRDLVARDLLVRRVRHEFEELPGLSLTPDQAARLFALRREVCHRIFEELVRDGTLRRRWDGRPGQYVARRSAP